MLKSSLIFFSIALFALLAADLEISTLDPWTELGRIAYGALTPDFQSVLQIPQALLNTVLFAFWGIALSCICGSILAFFFRFTAVRLFCSFIRSIHEVFWAFLFLHLMGLNALCGVLAIVIPYSGIFAKVYAEIAQESDSSSLEGVPEGTSELSRFFYGTFPFIYSELKHYTAYRFECALRSSAVLGFIGLPTLGFHLETTFREGLYSEALALLYFFFLLIASLKYWLKAKLLPVWLTLSFFLLPKTHNFSWDNFTRFFCYDIIPWPMRRAGVLDGSNQITFSWNALIDWSIEIMQTEAWEGLWNTVVLTQIVLVGSGIMALICFPFATKHLGNLCQRGFMHSFLLIFRTTPDYILAYVFVQLWGPSMLPAICAIILHNGAILGLLSTNNANAIQLRMDVAHSKISTYLFEVLPRIYGRFLAFLFYRWEIMMRESALLGILGVYTLGFYLDSAIADDHLDTVVFLLMITACLNMGIDSISQKVRISLKVSSHSQVL